MDFLERIIGAERAVLAGIVGALIALKLQDELTTLRGRLWFVATGIACAHFCTPLAVSWYSIDQSLEGPVGFLFGVFGGSLLTAGFVMIKTTEPFGLLKAIFTKKNGGQ